MKPVENSHSQPDVDERDQDQLRASRRSAILKGLGQGSVAMAALSPLASQASRSHVLYNSVIGTNCYCTVSGFQSAALSPSTGANPPTCATYLPRTFLRMPVQRIVYSSVVTGPVTNQKLKAYLIALPGVRDITSGVNGSLLAATPVPLRIPANGTVGNLDTVFLPIDGNSCYFLQARNFPTGIVGTGEFRSIFTNSADSRTLLEVLFEGVTTADGGAGNPPPTAKCYFLASFLSIANSNVSPALPADFDRTYVRGQYGADADAALNSNAGMFFATLCSKSA